MVSSFNEAVCLRTAAALGISEHIVSRALNHTTGAKASITSKRYIMHLYESERAAAFTAWAAHVEGLVAAPGVVSLRG